MSYERASQERPKEAAQLSESFDCGCHDTEQPIGMGRIVGDGAVIC